MKYLVWPVLQVGLLVAWFTSYPQLPWWVVFFPAMMMVGVLLFVLVIFIVALAAGVGTRFK